MCYNRYTRFPILINIDLQMKYIKINIINIKINITNIKINTNIFKERQQIYIFFVYLSGRRTLHRINILN